MLIDALRIMVNNPFKKKLWKKKTINILTDFFISHERYVKNFLK